MQLTVQFFTLRHYLFCLLKRKSHSELLMATPLQWVLHHLLPFGLSQQNLNKNRQYQTGSHQPTVDLIRYNPDIQINRSLLGRLPGEFYDYWWALVNHGEYVSIQVVMLNNLSTYNFLWSKLCAPPVSTP